jgi:hypothetical protein
VLVSEMFIDAVRGPSCRHFAILDLVSKTFY